MHGLSIGILQHKFTRYKVEMISPIKRKFGMAQGPLSYRSTSLEYGINYFLGIPGKIENELRYDLASNGGEIYFKYHIMPFVFKISGGKMIGRANDWYIRSSLGIAFHGGKTVYN